MKSLHAGGLGSFSKVDTEKLKDSKATFVLVRWMSLCARARVALSDWRLQSISAMVMAKEKVATFFSS